MDIDQKSKLNNTSVNDSKFVSLYMNQSGLRVGQESQKIKKKFKQIPINARSKAISKGGAYGEKLETRRLKGQVGKTSSGAALNKLGQKHKRLSLGRVPGLAMTKKQKKQLAKQQARQAA